MATGGVPQYGDGHSPDDWNTDLSNHGGRDGQGEHFTADEEMQLPYEQGSPEPSNYLHRYSDVDSSTVSQHHTLGPGHNQSSPGDHIHDGGSSKSLGLGAWVDISSQGIALWTASGTAPVLGAAAIVAKYCKIGTLVIYKFSLTAGTGTTFGTGFWKFLLPFQAKAPGAPASISALGIGSAYGFQSGTNNYAGVCELVDSTHVEIASHAVTTMWGATNPVTWAANTGNYFGFTVTYESVS